MRQAGVARHVDAIEVSVELGGAATAATKGHVSTQNRLNGVQRRGAVHGQLQCCITGRKRVLEAEGDDLDTELHNSWGEGGVEFEEQRKRRSARRRRKGRVVKMEEEMVRAKLRMGRR